MLEPNQLGLHNEFQATQGYIDRHCLKTEQKTENQNKLKNPINSLGLSPALKETKELYKKKKKSNYFGPAFLGLSDQINKFKLRSITEHTLQ